jgi:uncharacterized protein YjdB
MKRGSRATMRAIMRAAVAAVATVATGATLFATACKEPIGSGSGTPEWTVAVAPPTLTLNPGQQSALVAEIDVGAGAPVSGISVSWKTSNSGVATVSSGGQVTAVAAGTATITATATEDQGSGGLVKVRSSTATITVVAAGTELATTVSVSPASASLTVGGTRQLTATARDRNNTVLTGRPTGWTSSDNTVATVSSSGLVSAVNAGTATITATVDTAHGTSSITVAAATPAPVDVVSVSPQSGSVDVGKTLQLVATARDAGGNVISGRPTSWTVSDASVATVSGSGLVTGVAAGTATVTATVEGKSGTSAITVAPVTPPGPDDPVLVGAGDIASCDSDGDEATALLLDKISGTVFTLGDNVYNDGFLWEFMDCYEPSWGRHKARTKPSNGNHETYGTSDMAGYFDYFGPVAGERGKAYYSYNIGAWHVVVINNMIDVAATSQQATWLKADLAANPTKCTLAYWHYPLFTSGERGGHPKMRAIWQILYDAGVDLILNGHDHHYERFAPQDPNGAADAARGIRQMIIGTGGASDYAVSNPQPNSEVLHTGTFGVLKLTLHPASYTWEFVPIAGKTFTDSGTTACH